MGLLDEINEEEISASSHILRSVVPGYDYRSQEQHKETDRKIRDKLDRDLRTVEQELDAVHDRLYDAGEREPLDRVASVRDSVRTLRRTVRNARPGGGALRGLTVDNESDLISVIEYDAQLVETSEELVETAISLRESDDVSQRLTEFKRAVRAFEQSFHQRRDHLDGLR